MRKVTTVMVAVLLAGGLAACGSSSDDSSSSKAASGGSSSSTSTTTLPGALLSGKVNDKGTKDVASKGTTDLGLEADDFYFEPTYVKAAPGQRITIELENEGKATHTFTSSALGIDTTLAPDAKREVTVTMPMAAGLVEFHCNFHAAMGMRGAFVVGTGAGAATGTSSSSGSSSTTSTSRDDHGGDSGSGGSSGY